MHVPTYRFCHGTLARKISENCLEKTDLLARKSSDINYRDGQGNTILHFAANLPYNQWACSVLMDAMASDTAINEMGEMPIHLAIQCSNTYGLQTFLENKVDPEFYRLKGDSLLDYWGLFSICQDIEKMIHFFLLDWEARKAIKEIEQTKIS